MRKKIIFGLGAWLLLSWCAMAVDTDDGNIGVPWLPKELSAIREKVKNPTIFAKYEPEKGARYYVVEIKRGSPATFEYYKIDGEKITPIGKKTDLYPTPFGEFVDDEDAVSKLWNDYLARWEKTYDKKNIQQHLDLTENDIITEEEVLYFKKAGYTIPEKAQIIKKRQDYKELN